MKPVRFKDREERPLEVTVDRRAGASDGHYEIHVDGRAHSIQLGACENGRGWFRMGPILVSFAAVADRNEVRLWVNGRYYRVPRLVSEPPARGAQMAGSLISDLTAPMPGTVLKILVRPDEPFEAHQPLIIMESMKMELTLSAPHAGVVRQVTCEVGQLVEMGVLLAKLAPEVDASAAQEPADGRP